MNVLTLVANENEKKRKNRIHIKELLRTKCIVCVCVCVYWINESSSNIDNDDSIFLLSFIHSIPFHSINSFYLFILILIPCKKKKEKIHQLLLDQYIDIYLLGFFSSFLKTTATTTNRMNEFYRMSEYHYIYIFFPHYYYVCLSIIFDD